MECVGRQLVYSPSDVANFVACEHLAQLELGVALQGGRPSVTNAYVDLIKHKGEEHEASFLDALREAGRAVTSVELREPRDFEAGPGRPPEPWVPGRSTSTRPSSSAWVRGIADFLERVERPSALGSWSYEVLAAESVEHAAGGHACGRWSNVQRR
jgi:hypothetical protein